MPFLCVFIPAKTSSKQLFIIHNDHSHKKKNDFAALLTVIFHISPKI